MGRRMVCPSISDILVLSRDERTTSYSHRILPEVLQNGETRCTMPLEVSIVCNK